MLTELINTKLKNARYELLENGQYFAEIPSIRGVWAVHKNLQSCKKELQEVFEEWLVLQIADGVKIPGFSIPHFTKKETKAYA